MFLLHCRHGRSHGRNERKVQAPKAGPERSDLNIARTEKYKSEAVVNELRHNHRLIRKDKNPDIDPKRTHGNYTFVIDRSSSAFHAEKVMYGNGSHERDLYKQELSYYRHRMEEVYCYGRRDLVTIAETIITLPKENNSLKPVEKERFFEACLEFMADRYGAENIVSAAVHVDEGKTVQISVPGSDSQAEFHLGQEHLQVIWMPVTKINHKKLSGKKHHVKAMDNFSEKLCASEVINKKDLKTFHTDLQSFLTKRGIPGSVITGITKEQGGNRTVAEMKKEDFTVREMERNAAEKVIRQKNEIIKNLTEQLKEKNVLIEHLQEQLHQREETKDHDVSENFWDTFTDTSASSHDRERDITWDY